METESTLYFAKAMISFALPSTSTRHCSSTLWLRVCDIRRESEVGILLGVLSPDRVYMLVLVQQSKQSKK